MDEQEWDERAKNRAAIATGADIPTLLKEDHRRLEKLFDAYAKATRHDRKHSLARQICQGLIIHAKLEEEIFYPACRDYIDDDAFEEARVEHDGAKALMNDLLTGSPNQRWYDDKVKVLSELMKRHFKEEESRNDDIVARAKAGGADIDAITRQLKARGAQLSFATRKPVRSHASRGSPRSER